MWLFFIPVLLIVGVFFFVFIATVTGLVPYYFTVTSHLILTFSVALTTFVVFVISLFLWIFFNQNTPSVDYEKNNVGNTKSDESKNVGKTLSKRYYQYVSPKTVKDILAGGKASPLFRLTIPQLRTIAREYEINLKDAKNKRLIVSLIAKFFNLK